MNHIVITTDGSCLGNPGPGGWAAVMRCNNQVYEISGYQQDATNNSMEAIAVLKALSKVKKPCTVTIRSDSTYVLNNLQKDFEAIGWKTKTGKAVMNKAIWQEITKAREGVTFDQFVKVPAHSGDPDNERCDYLAKKQIDDNKPKPNEAVTGSLYQYVSKLEGRK